MEVNDSVSEEDEADDRMMDEFITNDCGCTLRSDKSPCSKLCGAINYMNEL